MHRVGIGKLAAAGRRPFRRRLTPTFRRSPQLAVNNRRTRAISRSMAGVSAMKHATALPHTHFLRHSRSERPAQNVRSARNASVAKK